MKLIQCFSNPSLFMELLSFSRINPLHSLYLSLSVRATESLRLRHSIVPQYFLSFYYYQQVHPPSTNFSYIKFHPRLSSTEYIERLPFAFLSPSSFHHTDFPFQLVAHTSPLHSSSGGVEEWGRTASNV